MRLVVACIAALSLSVAANEVDVVNASDGDIYSVFVDTFAIRDGMPSAMTGYRPKGSTSRARSVLSVEGCASGFGVAYQRRESGEVRRFFWSESGDRVVDALSAAICGIDDEARKRAPATNNRSF